MFDFFDSMCGCFSPDIKKNIIQYLSSANLNRNLMEEEKTNEGAEAPVESIYSHVKTKSYYFMKVQEDEQKEEAQSPQDELNDNLEQPNYYPLHTGVEGLLELYKNKREILRKLLRQEIGTEYSKVYDSQTDNGVRIYCKPEIYQNKRFNSYRFTFKIPHKEHLVAPKDYLNLEVESFNLHEPLLASREKATVTEEGMEIFHRKYKKVLVISQHQFYTAQKSEIVEEDGGESVYNTLFSVKGEWNKLADYSRGWINLAGLRVATHKEEESETSLRQEEQYLKFDGYINCQLQISVNANMLKQPIAKQIRTYVQKLICSLTKSDAI